MTPTDPRSACREARTFSSAILDLDQEMLDVIAAHRHIGECPSCKKFIDEMRTVADLVRCSPHDEVADDLARRIRARAAIQKETTPSLDPQRIARSGTIRPPRTDFLSRTRIAVAAAVLLAGFCGAVAGRLSVATNTSNDSIGNADTSKATTTDAVARNSEPVRAVGRPAPSTNSPSPRSSGETPLNVTRSQAFDMAGRVDDVLLIADDFLRYAHPLIEDVGRIEEIEQPLRRPLVMAEINYADLPRRAERILAPDAAPHVGEDVREVARFVMDLSGRIRSGEYAPGSDDAAGAKRLLVLRKADPRVAASRPHASMPAPTIRPARTSVSGAVAGSGAVTGSGSTSTTIAITSIGGDTQGTFQIVEGTDPEGVNVRLIEFFENFRRRTLPVQGFEIFVPGRVEKAIPPESAPVRPGDI